MSLAEIVNFVLGLLTIFGQIFVVAVFISLILGKTKQLFGFLSEKYHIAVFAAALIAMLGSLTYSDIIGYEPCKLCWLQRIFMYPIVFILAVDLWKKTFHFARYTLVLSSIGAVIALYHYLLQRGVAPDIGCDAVGYSVSCAKDFVMQFGYITIPMMSLTAFVLIGIFSFLALRSGKK